MKLRHQFIVLYIKLLWISINCITHVFFPSLSLCTNEVGDNKVMFTTYVLFHCIFPTTMCISCNLSCCVELEPSHVQNTQADSLLCASLLNGKWPQIVSEVREYPFSKDYPLLYEIRSNCVRIQRRQNRLINGKIYWPI